MGLADNVMDLARQAKETVVSALPLTADKRDIRNVLKRDHMLVSGIIDSLLEKVDTTDSGVMDLLDSLKSELLLHAKSEEQVLYQACLEHGKDVRSFAQEGVREHSLIEQLLERLNTERPGKDGELKATLTVLKEIVDHHVREEEGDLFLKLQKEFNADQLIQMGERMESLKNTLDVETVSEAQTRMTSSVRH